MVPIPTGTRFGSLVVVRFESKTTGGTGMWLCQCDCGVECWRPGTLLRRGKIRSCGCRIWHGEPVHESEEYAAWANMIQRCTNEKATGWQNYGGRGIRVCDEWSTSFSRFIADVGMKPSSEHSLDRIDVNGNYEPTNVRWATGAMQALNKRTNHRICIQGESLTVEEWAQRLGVNSQVIHGRLRRGWAPERAVAEPLRSKGDKGFDISGIRFGRWTVIGRSLSGRCMWDCVCDCGRYRAVMSSNLASGASVSCGCFRIEQTVARNVARGRKVA